MMFELALWWHKAAADSRRNTRAAIRHGNQKLRFRQVILRNQDQRHWTNLTDTTKHPLLRGHKQKVRSWRFERRLWEGLLMFTASSSEVIDVEIVSSTKRCTPSQNSGSWRKRTCKTAKQGDSPQWAGRCSIRSIPLDLKKVCRNPL